MKPILLRAATTFQGTNSAKITINDAFLDDQNNVVFSNATPYPSTIRVSGLTEGASYVTVTIRGLHHTSCADISMLLVPPDGTNGVVLMSQAGGFNNGNPPEGTVAVGQLTFEDNASKSLYTIGTWWPITNGTYLPTDAVVTNYFLPPAPAGLYSTPYSNYSTTLSGLNGALLNGTWSLYIQDESPGDDGVISNGWSLSIATAFGISGTVANYNSGLPVPGVTMNVTGDHNTTGLSDGNGTYDVLVNPGGTYTVTPQRTFDDPPALGVTTFDIVLIRRHISGVTPLDSPYKLLAADVTGAGSVTDTDIAYIRQLSLGLTNSFPAGLWKFIPSSYIFPDPQQPWTAPTSLSYAGLVTDANNQDFVAIKLGDVVNSLSGPAGNAPLVQFQPVNVKAQPGASIKAAITVGAFQNVTSVQFTMKWDPAVLQFTGVSDFALRGMETNNFGTVFVNSGELTFSWDDPQGSGVTAADGTSIFLANFQVLGPPGSSSSLALLDSRTLREVTVNAALAAFGTQNGQVTVTTTGPTRPVISGALDLTRTAFQLSVPTVNGVAYIVEYSNVLPTTNWTSLSTIMGDGTVKVVTDQILTNQSRFYRTRTP